MDGNAYAPHINAMGGGFGFGGAGFLEAILLFAIIGNGNGFGFGGNNNMNQITNDFMFANINGMLNSLGEKVCTTDRDVLQTKYDLSLQACSNENLTLGAINAVSHQLDNVKYDNLLNTDKVIQNSNVNTQRIVDALTANTVTALTTQVEDLKMKLMACEIKEANQPQKPIPAYPVPNPYMPYPYPCVPTEQQKAS